MHDQALFADQAKVWPQRTGYPVLRWQPEVANDWCGPYGLDTQDLLKMVECWLMSTAGDESLARYDLDGDGFISLGDVALLGRGW